jgi:thioredoxin 1
LLIRGQIYEKIFNETFFSLFFRNFTPKKRHQMETFNDVISSDRLVLVDFFATWCGPCKELAPVLDEIEQKHKGQVIFKRVDVDQEPELAMEFRVEAVPTLMFVTPKGEYQTLLGYQEAPVIEAKIAELLNRSTK